MLIWSDPIDSSYAKITITGPNDYSFLVFFTHKTPNATLESNFGYPTDLWLDHFSNDSAYPASGFIVNPTNGSAGEVFLDLPGINPKYPSDFSSLYTQNSNITQFDTEWKSDPVGMVSVTFERNVTSSDDEDWQFDFDNLLDPFYICFMINSIAYPNAFFSADRGCMKINDDIIEDVTTGSKPQEYQQMEGNC